MKMSVNRLGVMCCSMLMLCGSVMAQGSPYCPADVVFDNELNFFDVSEFISRFNDADASADINGDGQLNFFDVSAFLVYFSFDCPDLLDSDEDRIPDFAESDDGIFIAVDRTGTDPFNPDTDDDGIDDGDEALGTMDGLDLPGMGADPLRRDIFVECDWYAGDFDGTLANYRPSDIVIVRLKIAFENAPVENPYNGAPGINIHFDYGQGGVFTNGEQLPGEPIFLLFDFDFNILKEKHFDSNRQGYFHYSIFAHRYNEPDNNSSGIAERPGNDFMVTLSTYSTPMILANTIMHELGHNLGLQHGGFEERNWKPNYNSVMNYRYQFTGIDHDGDAIGDSVLDYSIGTAIDIDEREIFEAVGIDGLTPIDWNDDGDIDNEPYPSNINCIMVSRPCGQGFNCDDASCDLLLDQNDWDNIIWSRLTASVDLNPDSRIVECDNWPGR